MTKFFAIVCHCHVSLITCVSVLVLRCPACFECCSPPTWLIQIAHYQASWWSWSHWATCKVGKQLASRYNVDNQQGCTWRQALQTSWKKIIKEDKLLRICVLRLYQQRDVCNIILFLFFTKIDSSIMMLRCLSYSHWLTWGLNSKFKRHHQNN